MSPAVALKRIAGYAAPGVLAMSLLSLGCTGYIVDPLNDAGGPGPGGGPLPPGAASSSCDAASVGITELTALSSAHYAHTIEDLLGVQPSTVKQFPADEQVGPFSFRLSAVTTLQAELYRSAAEEAATLTVKNLAALVTCSPTDTEADCARTFVSTLAPRAYRAPVSSAEVDRLMVVYTTTRAAGGSFQDGVRVVITGILQSPKFLYHLEPSDRPPGSTFQISEHALASRMSYFLTGSMPDEALFQAAASGELNQEEVLVAQLDRLLASPRARQTVGSFHEQWLHISELTQLTKDTLALPNFTPSLAKAMQQEVVDFASHVLFQGDGRLETLLTAPYTTSTDLELLALYGADPSLRSAEGTVSLDPTARAGLLTRAAPMAALANSLYSSPIKRGVFVRQNLLCQPLPPPPDAVPPAPEVDPGLSTRQRFAQHTADPGCAGCHALIDPIGFGFENYDAIGSYRTAEGGRPVDASGALTNTDVDGAFSGAVELSARLAESGVVQQCVAEQWFRFALARSVSAEDECSMRGIQERFESSGGDVRELIRSIVLSNTFRFARMAI